MNVEGDEAASAGADEEDDAGAGAGASADVGRSLGPPLDDTVDEDELGGRGGGGVARCEACILGRCTDVVDCGCCLPDRLVSAAVGCTCDDERGCVCGACFTGDELALEVTLLTGPAPFLPD